MQPIYIVYPIILVVLLWGTKFKKIGSFNEEAFSLRQMKAIQGFVALVFGAYRFWQYARGNISYYGETWDAPDTFCFSFTSKLKSLYYIKSQELFVIVVFVPGIVSAWFLSLLNNKLLKKITK